MAALYRRGRKGLENVHSGMYRAVPLYHVISEMGQFYKEIIDIMVIFQ